MVIGVSFLLVGFLDLVSADTEVLTRSARFVARIFPPKLDPVFLRSLKLPDSSDDRDLRNGHLDQCFIGAALALPATSTVVLSENDESLESSFFKRWARRVVYFILE